VPICSVCGRYLTVGSKSRSQVFVLPPSWNIRPTLISAKRPRDRSSSPPIPVSNGYRSTFPWVKRPGREARHSSATSAQGNKTKTALPCFTFLWGTCPSFATSVVIPGCCWGPGQNFFTSTKQVFETHPLFTVSVQVPFPPIFPIFVATDPLKTHGYCTGAWPVATMSLL
jgi:hypothetical protein